MNRSVILTLSAISFLLLYACSGSIESKLIGTWEVVDVQTEFQESDVTPEMLRQVVEREKQTYFRIVNDSTLVIISSNNTYEASWVIEESSGKITYFFSGMEASPNELGTFNGERVIHESTTPMGRITTVYARK